MLKIIIDGKNYNFVKKISMNNKNYIVYSDDDTVYIGEYNLSGKEITINKISDEEFENIKEFL